jgi:outer membrane protein OmpA-like peptidoglycan-associated protein
MAGCAGTHFGVVDKATFVPKDFTMTEEAIQRAEASEGAKWCADKIAQAKALAKEGAQTYWACRTTEALDKLAEARKLAREAEMCRDTDGDGVPDHLDACPGTPAGVQVDAKGCPIDSDGDGVPDYLDKCPNTPKGVKVDNAGCPLDDDGDGVPNYLDECPGTPMGAKVNSKGCWVIAPILFKFDRWALQVMYEPLLEEVVSVMNQNPGLRMEIQGHTDDRGSAGYNLKLSVNRARTVKKYLVGRGISEARLIAVGYGIKRPVASNLTPEGQAKNRRVQLVPLR